MPNTLLHVQGEEVETLGSLRTHPPPCQGPGDSGVQGHCVRAHGDQLLRAQGEEREVMGALRTYVRDEFKDKWQQEVDTSSWPISCAAMQPCLHAHAVSVQHSESIACGFMLLVCTGGWGSACDCQLTARRAPVHALSCGRLSPQSLL